MGNVHYSSSCPPHSGVLYIFPSTATTYVDADGRLEDQKICPNEDPEVHFCNGREIENEWDRIEAYFDESLQEVWVDNFYESRNWVTNDENVWSANNSCVGWTENIRSSA